MSSARWPTLAMGIMSFIIFDNILSLPYPEILVAKNNDTICTTDECIQMAHTIHQNMRSDVDPCEDFYEFACGRYHEQVKKVGVGSFDEIKRLTYNQLKSIIIEGSNSDFLPLRMAHDYYQSCTVDETARKHGVRPIYEKLGKWPLTAVDKSTSWLEALRRSRDLGFFPDYIITINIFRNPHNNSETVTAILPPTLPIPITILQQGLQEPLTKKYLDLMMLIGVEFESLTSKENLKSTITNTLREIEKLFDFEVQLAKITPLMIQTEDLLSLEIVTLKQLKEQHPLINWIPVLQTLIGMDVKLNDAEKATVVVPKFMVELELLLEATPERVIINYFIWRNIFFSLYLMFAVDIESRSKACTTRTQNWKHAMEKLEAINCFVGYADSLLHRDTEMKKVYGSVHIDINNHFESSLNLHKLMYDQQISKLRQPSRDRVSSNISPVSINAYYVPTENSMIIPAAILQNPFYSVNRPNYLNFGTIGYVTGHELSHAFDNLGSHYNEYGQLEDWWQPETKAKYKDRTKCFVDQYGSYYLEEIDEYVNGYLTLGENMADNEGIKNAYRAYKSWQSTHEKEKKLPGLDYTPEQMFWISSANAWCAKYTSPHLNLQVQTDNHAPSMIRVNGQLSNQKEFAKDFSCPINSKMNPRKKCQFW